jgi:hypothetical protein
MPAIQSYGFGRVTIDGREETRDVIVLPERVVRGWWRREGHGLVLEDLDEVLDELPERLLVGTGAYGQMRPDPGTLETLRARGTDVEVLPTLRPAVTGGQLATPGEHRPQTHSETLSRHRSRQVARRRERELEAGPAESIDSQQPEGA